MPYFALVILALFAAIAVAGGVGAYRHFAGKSKSSAPRGETASKPPA